MSTTCYVSDPNFVQISVYGRARYVPDLLPVVRVHIKRKGREHNITLYRRRRPERMR